MTPNMKEIILDLKLDDKTIESIKEKFATEKLKGHAIAIIKSKDKIVLVERKTSKSTNKLCLPGGNIRHCESFEDGIRREMKEELNVDLNGIVPLTKITNRFIGGDGSVKMQSEGYIYLSESFTGEIKINEKEINSVKLVDINNIPSLKFRNDEIIAYVFNEASEPLHLIYTRD
jgi:ADP-ribose pyrophosphatase YjhB (NUDIX family)